MLTIAFTLAFAIVGSAQNESSASTGESKKPNQEVADTSALDVKGHSGIAIQGGLPGVGLEYAYSLNSHLNLRARGLFMSVSGINYPYTIDGRDIDIELEANALNFDLLLEYMPKATGAFKIVAGFSYVDNFDGAASIMLEESTTFGDVVLEPEDIGQIDLSILYSGFAPYMGLGFGRAVPKNRVGFSVELGTYYIGAPDVQIAATELFTPSANREQEENLEEALDSFRWMPSLMFKLAVKI